MPTSSNSSGKPQLRRTAAEGERCPRCESRDTKFCYYNNYNTSQPRHFCRSCRRYWTVGGSLRNVPIGGSSRKRPRVFPPSELPISRHFPGVASVDLSAPSDIGYPFLAFGEPGVMGRARFGLGLGLGLGSGSMEELGFGVGQAVIWPSSLFDQGQDHVAAGGRGGSGGCFAVDDGAAAAWPVAAPPGGGGAGHGSVLE